jgi:DNA-binding NarL/FixJ family response regulator
MDTEKTSIWLFSQQPIFRDGLRQLLILSVEFEVVGRKQFYPRETVFRRG